MEKTDEIINLVSKNPFSLVIDKILKLESLEKGACKINHNELYRGCN